MVAVMILNLTLLSPATLVEAQSSVVAEKIQNLISVALADLVELLIRAVAKIRNLTLAGQLV